PQARPTAATLPRSSRSNSSTRPAVRTCFAIPSPSLFRGQDVKAGRLGAAVLRPAILTPPRPPGQGWGLRGLPASDKTVHLKKGAHCCGLRLCPPPDRSQFPYAGKRRRPHKTAHLKKGPGGQKATPEKKGGSLIDFEKESSSGPVVRPLVRLLFS